MLIWPPDFSLMEEESLRFNIRNENGEIVASIGDRVRMSGGEIRLLFS